jgi:hypothetical protein
MVFFFDSSVIKLAEVAGGGTGKPSAVFLLWA